MSLKFDIFRRLPDGQPLWVQAVEGLDEAKLQLTRLMSTNPGSYFVFDVTRSEVIYTAEFAAA